MQQISGFSRDEVLGKRVVDVFPFLRGEDSESCFSAALAGEELVTESHPYAETGVFESRYSPLASSKYGRLQVADPHHSFNGLRTNYALASSTRRLGQPGLHACVRAYCMVQPQ